MSRELVFSITKKDFEIETFRAGGKGGQKQNKTNSGVRIRHRASGAVGEARDHREQGQNRSAAFHRLVDSDKFRLWLKIKCSEIQGMPSPESVVEDLLRATNLMVEIRENDKWVVEENKGT